MDIGSQSGGSSFAKNKNKKSPQCLIVAFPVHPVRKASTDSDSSWFPIQPAFSKSRSVFPTNSVALRSRGKLPTTDGSSPLSNQAKREEIGCGYLPYVSEHDFLCSHVVRRPQQKAQTEPKNKQKWQTRANASTGRVSQGHFRGQAKQKNLHAWVPCPLILKPYVHV